MRDSINSLPMIDQNMNRTWMIGLLALLIGAPTAFASPTSNGECFNLYSEYRGQLAQLRDQRRRKSDQAWQVQKSRGYNASLPFYDAARELGEEHESLLRRANQARNSCFQEVRAHKQQQAAERRTQAQSYAQGLIDAGVKETTNKAKWLAADRASGNYLGPQRTS